MSKWTYNKDAAFPGIREGEELIADVYGNHKEVHERVRLMTAPPELLEALKALKGAINNTEISGSTREINRALILADMAIAKAERKE